MHFCISFFAAICCFAIFILFIEVIPTWFKLALLAGGTVLTGLSGAYAIRKIAKLSKAFAAPELMTAFGFCVGITAVIVLFVYFKSKKKAS